MSSTEKLKAKAKAIASHIESLFTTDISIITKQNRLAVTVKAFFSVKYFFIGWVLWLWWQMMEGKFIGNAQKIKFYVGEKGKTIGEIHTANRFLTITI